MVRRHHVRAHRRRTGARVRAHERGHDPREHVLATHTLSEQAREDIEFRVTERLEDVALETPNPSLRDYDAAINEVLKSERLSPSDASIIRERMRAFVRDQPDDADLSRAVTKIEEAYNGTYDTEEQVLNGVERAYDNAYDVLLFKANFAGERGVRLLEARDQIEADLIDDVQEADE